MTALALAGANCATAHATGIGTWRRVASPPGESLGPAVALADGRMLLVYQVTEPEVEPGRLPGERIFRGQRRHLESEIYDPSAEEWLTGPSPPGEDASTLLALAGGGALLLGETECARENARSLGVSICRPTAAVYRLNADASQWQAAAPMRVARTRPGAVQLPDGRVLVAGGFGEACAGFSTLGWSCPPLSSAEAFDPVTGTWSPLPPMSSARGEVSTTVLSDGTALLVGGSSSNEELLRFHPRTNTWTTLPAPPVRLSGAQLLALPGDRAIALESRSGANFDGFSGVFVSAVVARCADLPEIYSLARGSWTPAPPLIDPPRAGHCPSEGAQLAHGQILVDGQVLDARQGCWSATGVPAAAGGGDLLALPNGGALALREERPLPVAETYAPATARCSPAQQVASSLFERLSPQGTIAAAEILSSSGYSFTIPCAVAGTIRVAWYAIDRRLAEPVRIVLARGRAVSHSGGDRVTIDLAQDVTERRELASRARVEALQLTGEAVFRRRDGESVTVTREFTVTAANAELTFTP